MFFYFRILWSSLSFNKLSNDTNILDVGQL